MCKKELSGHDKQGLLHVGFMAFNAKTGNTYMEGLFLCEENTLAIRFIDQAMLDSSILDSAEMRAESDGHTHICACLDTRLSNSQPESLRHCASASAGLLHLHVFCFSPCGGACSSEHNIGFLCLLVAIAAEVDPSC